MSDVLGVINLGEKENSIRNLTKIRPLANIPFAGRYRIIDFILSNMINSGIETISIVLKNKFHSLNDHIGPGKYWDLDKKTGGLKMLYPSLIDDNDCVTKGELCVIKDNLEYFRRTRKKHILLTRSNYIGNIDFKPAYKYHLESDNDITILTRKVIHGRNRVDLLGLDIVSRDGSKINIGRNLGNNDSFDLSIEMYLIKKEVFIEILTKAIESGGGKGIKEALISRILNYDVDVYKIEDDILPIYSIAQYYNSSMKLLNPEYAKYLFYEHGKIYTKAKDAPSTIYKKGSSVTNSLVANSCIVEGIVENSILFRDVRIKKGAIVRNSIIFEGTTIGEDTQINYSIIEKDVNISSGKVLMGDGGLPYFIEKGAQL